MRTFEGRYTDQHQNVDIVLRFLLNGARIADTVRWCGVSESHARYLRTFLARKTSHVFRRPHGRTPYTYGCFLRTRRWREESAMLACTLSRLGLVPPTPPSPEEFRSMLPDPGRTRLLCEGYEWHRAQVPNAQINFEYAILLATSLIRWEPLTLDNCLECSGLVVTEPFSRGTKTCLACPPPHR